MRLSLNVWPPVLVSMIRSVRICCSTAAAAEFPSWYCFDVHGDWNFSTLNSLVNIPHHVEYQCAAVDRLYVEMLGDICGIERV